MDMKASEVGHWLRQMAGNATTTKSCRTTTSCCCQVRTLTG